MGCLLGGMVWLLPASSAFARSQPSAGSQTESTSTRFKPYNGTISVGPALGLYTANGAVLHVGSEYGLVLSGGYAPVLASFTRELDSGLQQPVYRLYNSFQGDADLKFELMRTKKNAAVGLRSGYRFNTLLRHGFALGGYAGFPMAESWTLELTWGLLIFVDGANQVRSNERVPGGGAKFAALSPWLQGGIGAAFVWSN